MNVAQVHPTMTLAILLFLFVKMLHLTNQKLTPSAHIKDMWKDLLILIQAKGKYKITENDV